MIQASLRPIADEIAFRESIEILTGQISPRGAKSMARHTRHIDIQMELDGFQSPVRDIRIVGGGGAQIPWLSRQLSLANRIPISPDEFRAFLTFKKGRPIDAETVMHAVADIVRSRNDLCLMSEQSVAYVCNSFVILVYKSIENCASEYNELIEGVCSEILALAGRVPQGDSVREDPVQAQFSVLTAMCHYWLSRGDLEKFQAVATEIVLLDKSLQKYKVTYCYNVCCTLLLLGLLRAKSGNKGSAIAVMQAVVAAFRRSAAIPTEHVVWFRELAISHQASTLALEVISSMRSGSPVSPALVLQICSVGSRVSRPWFVDKIKKLFDEASV